ncbi:MAG: helix-turn-helix domain-containing protein [Clostridia bacterium]|nr:helix-turn-helix domain-containing protein [Clostridia bacterium]
MNLRETKVTWIELCTYLKNSAILEHNHNFFHYIYVDEGIGNIKIGDTHFNMKAGDIYMISPCVNHAFSNCGDSPLKTIEIKFDVDNETEELISSLPFYMSVRKYPIKSLLMSAYREALIKEPLFTEIVSANLELMLTYLLRANKNLRTKASDDIGKSSPEIDKVLIYIHENLAEDISLDTLAEIAGFEKNYFLRKFKKITQCTPMKFIRESRIEKAKELLCYSDMNVSQIAIATGFKTVHYFSRAFFESTGIRPSNYRNE